MDLSIVIPLYVSEKTIVPVVEELQQELACIHIENYEIILVNDCSPDNVLAVAKDIARQDKRIKIISLARNSGQMAALMTGYRHTSGKYIVSMDDDYQTPGNEIGKLIEKLEKDDLDVVFAYYPAQKQSRFRLFGSFVHYKMAEIMLDKPKGVRTNSFYIMRKFVRDEIVRYNNNYPYTYGIIFAITSKCGNVDTNHRHRMFGKSNHSFRKLVGMWLNGFLNFSTKPLRVSAFVGFIVAFFAAVGIIWTTIMRILNPEAPLGWASMIIAILFFSGVQLVSIGLLGEYLGRLYVSVSKVPTTVVRETVNFSYEEEKANEGE